jgi:hypothetical protein
MVKEIPRYRFGMTLPPFKDWGRKGRDLPEANHSLSSLYHHQPGVIPNGAQRNEGSPSASTPKSSNLAPPKRLREGEGGFTHAPSPLRGTSSLPFLVASSLHRSPLPQFPK